MARSNYSKQFAKFTKARAGWKKDVPPKSQIPLGGKKVTQAAADAIYAAALQQIDDLNGFRAQEAKLTAQTHQAVAAAEAFDAQSKAYFRATMEKGDPRLADFGYEWPKRKVATVSEKSQAAQKAQAKKKAKRAAIAEVNVTSLKTGTAGQGNKNG